MTERSYSVSKEDVERMRKQLGELKKGSGETMQTQALIESMDRLHEALARMVVILENANRAMAQDALQGMRDEHTKLDKLLEQNEKLARAIVSLADMVKEQRSRPAMAPVMLQQPVMPPTQSASPMPLTPLAQPMQGHDEMSFLAQPAVGQRPYAPPVPQAPTPSLPGTLPPLPPMPTAPPAPNGASQAPKRPILRSFA